MNKITALIILLTAFSFASVAQVITDEEMDNLLNSQEIQIDNPIISNLIIRQIDDRNSMVSHQNNSGVMQNKVFVKQQGNDNTAIVTSLGNNIFTEVTQIGDKNIINSYMENYHLESRTVRLMQEGNNNRIDFSLYGDEVPSGIFNQEVRISQYGDNHTLNYMKENDFNSVEITQTPGIDGAGMTVDVSTSAFSFPMK